MWDRRAEYMENHDGDTVKMILDQGFGDTKQIDVRLLGVFAPELKEVGGPEMQAYVEGWFHARAFNPRWNFIVTTARMKVADREQKTLDRWVGTITTLDGSENLNMDVMYVIAARGYGGGTGAK